MPDDPIAAKPIQQNDSGSDQTLEVAPKTRAAVSPDSSPESWLSRHTPGLLVLFLALSNVAAIVKFLQDSTEIVYQVDRLIPDYVPLWLWATLMIAVVLVGNILLTRYLYRRFAAHQIERRRLMTISLIAILVTAILFFNVYAALALRPDLKRVKTQLETELLSAQPDGDESGFRTTVDNPSTRQDAWTSAQAVEALLSADDTQNGKQIRSALHFLQNSRGPTGWAEDSDPTVIRTEISSWVIIAHLRSLRSSKVWSPGEEPQISALVSSYIDELIAWQNSATGAWSSLPLQDVKYDRTYPTAMAVWALTEVCLTTQVDKHLQSRAAGALKSGLAWLINSYRPGYGWDAVPQRHTDDRYEGLNFQTFFAIENAITNLDEFSYMKNLSTYEEMRRGVLDQLHPVKIAESSEIHSTDLDIEGKACWATFLSYPWSSILAYQLLKEPDLASADRRKISAIARIESYSAPELAKDLAHKDTWKVGENLIGLSYVKSP